MNIVKLFICILSVFIIQSNRAEKVEKKLAIAIIGANLGGVSLTHYLNQKFQGNMNITIFEKTNYFGGSIKSVKHGDKLIEAGSDHIYDWYLNIKELLNEYALNFTISNLDNHMAFYDGEEFLINTKKKELIQLLKQKYKDDFGIIVVLLKRFHKDFQKIYDVVNKSPKKTIHELIKATDLDPVLLNKRTDQFLMHLNLKVPFIDELVRTLLFTFNNMNTNMHIYGGLRTMFNFFTAKFIVKQGFITLLREILYNKKFYNRNTFLKLESEVYKIKYLKDERKYLVYYKNSGKNFEEKFDKVVLSTLLRERNGIELEIDQINQKNYLKNKQVMKLRSYMIIGNLKIDRFTKNIENFVMSTPDSILVNDIKNFKKFNQIVNVCTDCYTNRNYEKTGKLKNSLYKVASYEDLVAENFQEYFMDGFAIKDDYFTNNEKVEKEEMNQEQLPDILLDNNGLYYLKSYEYLHSNLEYSTIFAKNIAQLIYEESKSNIDYLDLDL